MAGMFYSLKEVAEKLNKTEDEIKEIVKTGRLREFRDGPNLLFKVDEVESLLSDTTFMASQAVSGEKEPEAEEQEISLAPEAAEAGVTGGELADADTAMAGEGINVLGEMDEEEYKLTDDTMAETRVTSGETSMIEDMKAETKATGDASLQEIEEDVNLDTFGSGSGLLDLSLQADDTSLGGILDEIYTSEGEEGKQPEEPGSAMEEVAAEAEQMLPEEEIAAPEPVLQAPAIAQAYIEPAPDRSSNVFGIMLVLPLLVLVYTAIVAIAGQSGVIPSILGQIQGLILPVLGGFALVALILTVVGFMPTGTSSKTTKKPKAKKEKKKKAKETPPPAPESEIAEGEIPESETPESETVENEILEDETE